jgi:hypothetical protein
MTKDLKDDAKKRVLEEGEEKEKRTKRIASFRLVFVCGGVCLGFCK